MTEQPSGDFSGFFILLARLWRARFLVVALTIFATIGAYLILKYAVGETFESEAVLYSSERVDGQTWDILFTNYELIETVRKQFKEKYPRGGPYDNLINFAKRFHVEMKVIEDTSLRKRFSPSMMLQARARNPKEAHDLAEMWVAEIIRRYGGVGYMESQFIAESTKRLIADLEKQAETASARQTEIETRVIRLQKRFLHLQDLLAPAVMPDRVEVADRLKEWQQNTEFNLKFQMQDVSQLAAESLINRRLKVGIDLAQLEGQAAELEQAKSNDAKLAELKTSIAGKKAELKSISDAIAQTEKDLESAAKELVEARGQFEVAQTQLEMIQASLGQAKVTLAEHSVKGHLGVGDDVKADVRDLRVDLHVASAPSMPDRRIRPKRATTSIAVGVLTALLSCFILAVNHAVEHLPKLSR